MEQDADVCQAIVIWIGVHCNEAMLQVPTWATLQAVHDRHSL